MVNKKHASYTKMVVGLSFRYAVFLSHRRILAIRSIPSILWASWTQLRWFHIGVIRGCSLSTDLRCSRTGLGHCSSARLGISGFSLTVLAAGLLNANTADKRSTARKQFGRFYLPFSAMVRCHEPFKDFSSTRANF